jgi:hypothetical protein
MNESQMFKPWFKVHSNIVHPAACPSYGIMWNSLDAPMPPTYSGVSTDLLPIFCVIKEHVDAHGIN